MNREDFVTAQQDALRKIRDAEGLGNNGSTMTVRDWLFQKEYAFRGETYTLTGYFASRYGCPGELIARVKAPSGEQAVIDSEGEPLRVIMLHDWYQAVPPDQTKETK